MRFNLIPPKVKSEEELGCDDAGQDEFRSDSVSESLKQMRTHLSRQLLAEEEDEVGEKAGKPLPTLVRKYGLQPKFVRMRDLHLLLFYLTRGYEGRRTRSEEEDKKEEDRAEAAREIGRHCGSQFDQELVGPTFVGGKNFLSMLFV